MTKALGVAAMATLICGFAPPASATDQNIPLQATVTSFCKINGSLTPANDTLQTITVTDGIITSGLITRSFPIVCNKASNISITAKNGGLVTSAAAASGFDNLINYTVSTTGFADSNLVNVSTATVPTAALNASELLGSTTRALPGSSSISVLITPAINTNPLVQGTYDDTVVLTISPQP